nr:RHS repeat-associated core domain-containing protein [Bacteroidota bacterium]
MREEMRIADSLSLQMPDTLLQIKIGDTLITYIFASRINNIPNSVSYIVLSQTYISEGSQMIDVLDTYGETMSISIDELMQGSNLLSTYNYTGTNDPFYEPYTFYNTLCNTENTYYVYDHLGNTRITYTPTVMPDGLKFTLNGVYDYYPYGKILREYVQGSQEKYLTTHHQRDEETGLDYRGARFYDCDIARFLSLDPLAVKFASWSAYNYVMGNPISLIDPTGQSADWYEHENEDGTKSTTWVPGSASSVTVNGQTYNNAGSLSVQNSNGVETIWDQNELVSVDGQAPSAKTLLSGTGISYTTVNPEPSGQVGINWTQFQAGVQQNAGLLNIAEAICTHVPLIAVGGLSSIASAQAIGIGTGAMANFTGQVTTNATKGGVQFGENVLSTTTRVGKNGNAVEVLFKNGGKMDINAARVKEWVPNLHPNAPAGTLNKVKFDNFLPVSKGFKRTPTSGEIDFLNGLFN